MRHPVLYASVMVAALFCNAALACGQAACDEPGAPGKPVQIRGYGYGFEGGNRPVTLRWAIDGSVAGQTQIDPNGDFIIEVVAPDRPGLHKLVVTVGDADPTPVDVTVPVLLPWYRQPLEALRTLPHALGAALGALLLGGTALAAFRLRSRQRRSGTVPG
jgi:hypothetical protein